ncbi:MAG: sugar-binding transcriptional regulator, partial [Spirochaetes bacterium]
INDRVIGIETDGIRNIPRVVAVAGGPEKTQAVRGALNSGLIDVLITDYKTGKNLLEEQL